MNRTAEVTRTTGETDIRVKINLDGTGDTSVSTGIGFFDHMLTAFARHALIDLDLTCAGDLCVDTHHTVEDCGLALGQALRAAIGDKRGIRRYGFFLLPMDESLATCALDLSERPYCAFTAAFGSKRVGEFETETVQEFYRALSTAGGMTLHIGSTEGNAHHMIEAMFKAFGRALRAAVELDARETGVPSTKGAL